MNDETLPTLFVGWDQERQQVHLRFDPKELKDWDFIMALLDMAKEKVRAMKTIQNLQQMQAAQEHAQEQARIAAVLKTRGIKGM
jgi:hypothetical protein